MGGRRLGPHFWPPPGRPNVCEPTEAAYNDMTRGPNVCEPTEAAYNDMTPGEKATLMLCELLPKDSLEKLNKNSLFGKRSQTKF